MDRFKDRMVAKRVGDKTGSDVLTENHVLIVEDDENLAALMERWIREHYGASVDVRVAHTIDEGNRTLAALSSIDVVLLDRHFPAGTGVDLLDTLHAQFDPIVVMITGVEPDTELIRFPVADYLVKPIERQSLIKRVALLEKLATSGSLDAYSNARKASLLEFHLDDPESDPLFRRFAAQWSYDRLEVAASAEGVYVYELYTGDRAAVDVSIVGTLSSDLGAAVARGALTPIGEVVATDDRFVWIDIERDEVVDPPAEGYVVYAFSDASPEQLVSSSAVADRVTIERDLESAYE